MQLDMERDKSRDLSNQVMTANKQAIVAEKRIAELERLMKPLEDLKFEYDQVKQDNKVMKQKNNILSERIASVETQMREARAGKTSAERMCQGAERREARLKQAHEDVSRKLEELQRGQGSLEEELRAARDANGKLQAEVNAAARELKKIQGSANVDANRCASPDHRVAVFPRPRRYPVDRVERLAASRPGRRAAGHEVHTGACPDQAPARACDHVTTLVHVRRPFWAQIFGDASAPFSKLLWNRRS
eukprot:104532-Prorocentrum_minimum.AAC.3